MLYPSHKPIRFWWTESPPKSAQKRTLESRPAQKGLLRVSPLFWVLKKVPAFFAVLLLRAQETAHKSKSLKTLIRVDFSKKCSGKWVAYAPTRTTLGRGPLLSMSTPLSKPTHLSTFLSTLNSWFTLKSPFLSGSTLMSALLGTFWRALGLSEHTSRKH